MNTPASLFYSFTPRHPILHYQLHPQSMRAFVDHQLPHIIKAHYDKYQNNARSQPFPFRIGQSIKNLTTTVFKHKTHLQPNWVGPCTVTETHPTDGSLRATTPHCNIPRRT